MEAANAVKGSIASNAIDLLRDDDVHDDIVTKMASIKLVERVADGSKLANKTDMEMASWSELPLDIVVMLLEKIETTQDFLNFILVCKLWLSVAKESFSPLPHKLPLLQFFPKKNPLPMLLKSCTEDPYSDTYSLYCVANNKTYGNFYAPEISNKWIAGSTGGWLVTVDIKNLQFNLFNPLTRKQMSVPPLNTLPNPIDRLQLTNDKFWFVNKVLLFSDPEEDQGNYMVVALVSNICTIAYCRIKDKKWKRIEKNAPVGVVDIIKHNNVLYAINYAADLYAIDFTCNMKVTLVAQFSRCPRPGKQGYLMDSSEELLLLIRIMGESDDNPMTHKFEIFKLKDVPRYSHYYITEDNREHNVDEIRYQWSEVKSIGDQIVFVGQNQTKWFDSNKYPGCKANCIYFADDMIEWDISRVTNNWHGDRPVGNDVGIYHIADDRIETFSGFSSCPLAQTVWFFQS